MATWVQGSDRQREVESKSIRAGLPPAPPLPVPMGTVHAVDIGAGLENRLTPCGRTVSYVWADVPWENVAGARCRLCREVVESGASMWSSDDPRRRRQTWPP